MKIFKKALGAGQLFLNALYMSSTSLHTLAHPLANTPVIQHSIDWI